MEIAIIGAGNVGSTLAKGWARVGHTILLGVRDPERVREKELASLNNISVHGIGVAVARAETIVVAVPPEAVAEVARALTNVSDKVIIDVTNSFLSRPEGFENGFQALMKITDCRHIVKAFNTTGFENMAQPAGLDLFVSGDSTMAKSIVRSLAKDLGFAHCYDFGGNNKAALQEQLGMAWINLALMQGLGTQIGLNIVKQKKSS